jgi:hypothetical protein
MTEPQKLASANWMSRSSKTSNTQELLHQMYQEYGLYFITSEQYVWTHSEI